ncbi:tetratricopeptide repeat protein [candidate division WOR-3 bacterium]|nr:tetratricopeptide repeat protein [candidate division WOR-3 bacterium]
MKGKFLYTFFPLLLMSIVFYSCSARYSHNQILFGIEAAQMELWDEAIFRWKKAISQDPNNAPAHNNLAIAYEKKGMWEEAEKEYQTALDLDPKNERIKANFEKFKQDQLQKSDDDNNENPKDKKEKTNEKIKK